MPTFDSASVSIHYEVFGEGKPIVLVHGFTGSVSATWAVSGWIETLTPLRQVSALDCRGHGESEKPYDPAAYAGHQTTDDLIRLLDHLSIDKTDLFGYSIGAGISLRALVRYPERFASVVLGGIGIIQQRGGRRPGVPKALLTDDPSTITDLVAKRFRTVAETRKADLKAMAAFQRSEGVVVERAQLERITTPVLIVNGAEDTVAGSAHELVAAISGVRFLEIPDAAHGTTLPDQRFKDAVVAFLKEA